MATFVLNENVVICATAQTNVRGERDLTCFQLVLDILDRTSPHQLAWSRSVFAHWSSQAQTLQRRQVAIQPTFMNLFSQVQFDVRKCPIPPHGDPPSLPDEATWSTKLQDDRDFIRLAAFFHAILATTDEPLRRDVAVLQLDVTHGFKVLFPDECITRIEN